MLGNWSFGDYFKKDAIDWAWELLTGVYKLDKDRLYATIFEGSASDNVSRDNEAFEYWKNHLPEDRIILGNKKDNFWEMGDTGPCGPCSEIHIDLRDDEERAKIPGRELVNQSDPLVIEIWNLVFMQFNRRANGSLEELPARHVDTGMGFERLCMAIQGKKSNYDTDIFQDIIAEISSICGKPYGQDEKVSIAMRVIADHLRAISFAIADGQLPSNNKAGYVIRRILRRAVRYGYTFLEIHQPFIYKLLPVLITDMGETFPELGAQQGLIQNVIREEEESFLRTLETGITLLDEIMAKTRKSGRTVITGKEAFTLYDTFGFPLDLTELILKENGMEVDHEGFKKEMEEQKNRSRNASAVETEDWVEIRESESTEFVGYDTLEAPVRITRYRKVTQKKKTFFQLVFDRTPFYAESGGQVGDTGTLEADGQKIRIIDTQKENNLSIHIVDKLPEHLEVEFMARVDESRRRQTANNHTATHLLDYALRKVLGTHVEQKGSLVKDDALRFDFSHFQKVTAEELQQVEQIANSMVRQNLALDEHRAIPIEEAQQMGAIALFGEKYGDFVRMVKFGESVELCGGTHVPATGQIGQIVILSESAISAGVRRIEAITADKAEEYIKSGLKQLADAKALLGNPKDLEKAVADLLDANAKLRKQIEGFERKAALEVKKELVTKVESLNGMNVILEKVALDSPVAIKDLAYQLRGEVENLFLVLGAEVEGKASLTVMISDNLIQEKGLNAGQIIREIAKEVQGGGGGQPFYANAGGKNPAGIPAALNKARQLIGLNN
ncbi:MAG: alanine--tRNA ligase, partial [Bacteroidota bacterium]|nr:alanine--tRNA ligase [Bacteroidota bacterium]